jgi:hypothetical protein
MFKTNSDYQKKLLKRWAPILEKGAPIESVEKKLVVAQCLENTRKEFCKKGLFTEAAPSNTNNLDARHPTYNAPISGQGVLTANDYILPNVVMPMLRRIFPTLMAHELVGVQAMTGPTGLVMALRAVAANPERVGLPQGYEFGYGNKGRANQSIFTGDVASKTAVKGYGNNDEEKEANLMNKLYRENGPLDEIGAFLNGQYGSQSGRGVATGNGEGFARGTDGTYTGIDGKDYPYGNGAGGYAKGYAGASGDIDPTFGHWRNNTYPQATIKFEKRLVAAETRKLGSEWTPEDAEDLEAMQGIDLETEMTNLISYQIGAEIDQQIKESMILAAWKDSKVLDVSKLDGLDQMGRIAAMLTFVTREANEISIKTRRGAGNFVLASTTVCSCLQQLGTSKLVSDGKTMPSVPASAIGAMTKEGLINDGRQLLVRDTNTFGSYALVGYKGTHAGDSGIIYCPYIPVTLYKAIKPENGLSVIGARTRYGLVDNPYDAENFYSLIKFTGFDQGYSLGNSNRTFFGDATDSSDSNFSHRSGLIG